MPSDADLDAIQAADAERRKSEVHALLADEQTYEVRLQARGYRTYEFWGKGRFRGRRLTNITRTHTASAAVNEGSVKAIRTTLPADHGDHLGGLPRRPSLSWLRTVDKNAATDQVRTEIAERGKRDGIRWATEPIRAAQVPAKRSFVDPSLDYNGRRAAE